jgi:hypothetical protein
VGSVRDVHADRTDVAVHRNLGVIAMRQVASTIAKILEIDFPTGKLSPRG